MHYAKPTDRNWEFVAFYTPAYAEEALKLKETLDEFDVGYLIAEVKDKGDWYKNTSYKAEFVFQMLSSSFKNVVYIDVDARLKRMPAIFDRLTCDIAFHRLNNPGNPGELLGGTIFFRNCDKVKAMIDQWIIECMTNDQVWEQRKLDKCLRDKDLEIYILPVEYCAIFDHPSVKGTDVVILHEQASRRLKRGV